MNYLSELAHRWLKFPYGLYVRENRRGNTRLTILFLHGLGDTGKTWQPVIEQLPKAYRVISIDLLGFGRSPQPKWAELNVALQARSIGATLLRLRTLGPVIIVGHSMGGLVAVEVARRHPRLVKGVVLCSPPFYKPPRAKLRLLSRDEQLRRLYSKVKQHPLQFLKLVGIATRLRVIGPSHEITPENITSYISALEASIINQSSLDDAKQLKQPVRVLHGVFDPVVIRANLRELIRSNPQTAMKHVLAGHEIKGTYTRAIVRAIEELAQEIQPPK